MSMMLLVSAGSRLAVGSSARMTAGRCASARAGDEAAGHADRAGSRLDEAVEGAEERGLAGAAPSQDDDELTLANGEVDLVQRDRRGRPDDAEPQDLDHGGGRGLSGAERR